MLVYVCLVICSFTEGHSGSIDKEFPTPANVCYSRASKAGVAYFPYLSLQATCVQ